MELKLEIGRKEAGSWDAEPPAERMRAIGLVMQHYYNTKEWLKARDQDKPGLRRLS